MLIRCPDVDRLTGLRCSLIDGHEDNHASHDHPDIDRVWDVVRRGCRCPWCLKDVPPGSDGSEGHTERPTAASPPSSRGIPRAGGDV